MINPFLNPWNIYGSLDKPNPSLYGSEIINGHEYYISFMPPLFFLEYKQTYAKILEEMSANSLDFNTVHTEMVGCSYTSQFPLWFSNKKIGDTTDSMYNSIHAFFDIEKRILEDINPLHLSHLQLLGLLHCVLNALQIYIHPIESFSTGKVSPYNPFFSVFKNEKILIQYQSISPLIESLFIPMSLLTKHHYVKSKNYKKLMDLMASTIGTDKNSLAYSFNKARQQYGYEKYMDTTIAIEVCTKIAKKCTEIRKGSNINKIISRLLNLNGLLTWSKFIYYSDSLKMKRFDTFHIWYPYIVAAALKEYPFNPAELQTYGLSTTEKEAKIVYMLKTISKNSKKKMEIILGYSYDFESKYFSV